MDHLVAFFSKTKKKQKNTTTEKYYFEVEQELLAILLALQHFDVYLPFHGPIFKIYSGHHTLQFLTKFRFKEKASHTGEFITSGVKLGSQVY